MGKLIYLKNGEKIEEEFDDRYNNDYCSEANELINQNYTVILSYDDVLNIDLSKIFIEEDYINLMEVVSSYSKEKQDKMLITNHIIRNGLEDTDRYDYGHVKYILDRRKNKYSDEYYNQMIENRNPINILDILARQRIGKLTSSEEKIYSKYANFDLDFLLFSDSDTIFLNTDNCGFITIFDDCTFKNTNTTNAHSKTYKKQVDWYLNTHQYKSSSEVKIYIFKGTVAFYIPENMNDYQEKELSNIINELDNLSKSHNKDLIIEAAIVNDSMGPLEMFQGLNLLREKFCGNKKSKINKSLLLV